MGLLSYGSWSAECWLYFASLSAACLDIVPSQGCSAPVIRFNSVDLPVPLFPRIATRESMLSSHVNPIGENQDSKNTHSIPNERPLYK